jgi:predicted ArsR family transcriptional regulator
MTTGRAFDAAEVTAQISAISILNEPLRRALYAYLLSQPGAVGREEAGQGVGITRGLAAFHLDKLLEEGLVDVEYRRLSGKDGPGAGRPAKLYRVSDRQLEISLPGRRYELAARLLAEAFAQQGTDPAEALDKVAHRFGEGLGAQARHRLGRRPSDTRLLHTACEVLRDHGFDPTDIGGTVRLHNCPFQSIAKDHPELVCGMNVALARGLLAGLGAGGVEARLEPQPGMCCVAFSMAKGGKTANQSAIGDVGDEAGQR